MKNLLIGNGINIQFGDNEYCNKNIINRAISNLNNNNFNPRLYPSEIGDWLMQLHSIYSNLLNGTYDKHAFTSYEQSSLKSFKKRYKYLGYNLLIDKIGFEDYFIIHDILCRSKKNYFDKRHKNREFLRRLFLDSIYYSGKIQNIYKKFPNKFKSFLEKYNLIFTTNYDMNIEKFSKKKVLYLHGAFHILDEIYNPRSFKNMLSNAPVKKTPVIRGYEYLFSNALTSHSGKSKVHNMLMHSRANIGISEFANAISNKELNIESCINSRDINLKSYGEAIKLKSKEPSLSFSEYYPLKDFKKIQDTIDIIGLSPNNDSHLFDIINNNPDLQFVRFYYHDIDDINFVKKLFSNFTVEFFDIRNLWKRFS